MAGVPKGFHRLNLNCPEPVYQRLLAEVQASNQSIARFVIAAITEKLSGLTFQDMPVTELPEELQVLLGKPAYLVEPEEHDETLDLPERLR